MYDNVKKCTKFTRSVVYRHVHNVQNMYRISTEAKKAHNLQDIPKYTKCKKMYKPCVISEHSVRSRTPFSSGCEVGWTARLFHIRTSVPWVLVRLIGSWKKLYKNVRQCKKFTIFTKFIKCTETYRKHTKFTQKSPNVHKLQHIPKCTKMYLSAIENAASNVQLFW